MLYFQNPLYQEEVILSYEKHSVPISTVLQRNINNI